MLTTLDTILKRYTLLALLLPPVAVLCYALRAPERAESRAPRTRAPIEHSEHSSSLALNLPTLQYWSAQTVFADLFRQGSRWYREDLTTWAWDSGPPLAVDANGWVTSLLPNQAASVLIARGPYGLLPIGTYQVRWNGVGNLDVVGVGAKKGAVVGQTMEVLVDHLNESGIQLRLTATNPLDPLRDIRVYPPGVDPNAPPLFHPGFVDLLGHFRAIRFMDFQRTNDSLVVNWSDRPVTTSAVQTGPNGVALEYMIALCNEVGADAWFCMPHRATDEYVRNFARVVQNLLDPSLRVFVEYSNELWNGGFQQAQYAAQMGAQMGLSGSTFQNQLKWGSRRAVQVFELWREVYGTPSAKLVCVLAGQSVNTWTGEVILDFEDAYQAADAYAVAPYFGARLGDPQHAPGLLGLTQAELEQTLFEDQQDTFDAIAANVALATERELPLIAYEGGQHLVGTGGMQENQAVTDLFVALNRDPVMGKLYVAYLDAWRDAGAQEMFLWNLADEPSKFGSWGLLESTNHPLGAAPKWRATTQFIANNPPWW